MRLRRLFSRIAIYYVVACVALGIILAEVALHPQSSRTSHPELLKGLAAETLAATEDVEVSASDGAVLRGWFVEPSHSNGRTVIVAHGVGDNREGMLGIAGLLLEKNYNVLIPDSRGHGESGGDFVTYGIKEAGDVARWVDWLTANKPGECVFAIGESMGGAVVLQAMARKPPLCAVVAESPFSSFREIAYDRVGQIFRTGPWLGRMAFRPAVEIGLMYGRARYQVDLAQASPEAAVENSSVPVLLVHGLVDDNVRPRHSHRIQDRNPSSVALWEVPNAGHCGAISAAQTEFQQRIVQFFSINDVGPRRQEASQAGNQ